MVMQNRSVRALTILSLLLFGACASSPSDADRSGVRDPSSTTSVLLIGDSQTTGNSSTKHTKTNSTGLRLSELLEENSHIDLSTYGSCGSRTDSWVNGTPTKCGYFEKTSKRKIFVPYPKKSAIPTLATLLSRHTPSIVIVSLGTNFVGGYTPAAIKKMTAAFVKTIRDSGAKCVWVGPADLRKIGKLTPDTTQIKLSEVDVAIQQAVDKNCPYISTHRFVGYPSEGGDGVHFSQLGEDGRELADTWAKAALTKIQDELPELR